MRSPGNGRAPTPAGLPSSDSDRALGDIARLFGTPQAIVNAEDLDRRQKIALLRQWEVALARRPSDGLLGQVRQALTSLGAQRRR